ncbi:MAG: hypothetical protein JWO58_1239 [Chitinophagaceae bacterium]|nr:hypothetical protein [Chitinophagaceae bacterium]
MKRNMFLLVLLLASQWACAQSFTAKTIKNEVINDYKQIPDSALAYPLRGLSYVKSTYSGNEIEFWILDAKGRLIYYNIVSLMKNDRTMYMDPEYVRYMKLQGMHQWKIKS